MVDKTAAVDGGNASALGEVKRLKDELDAVLYENSKINKINKVLMQRVEMGWGNFSTAYSSFQNAALLAEKVKSKSIKLRQTQTRLHEANQDLSRSREESEQGHQRMIDLIESISDAVVLFDRDRHLLLANSRFYDFWKNTNARIEVGETRLADLVPMSMEYGIFDPVRTPVVRATARGGKIKDSVFRLSTGNWMQMSERPTSDGGLAVVYTDITQIKEDELLQQERVLADKNRVLQSMLDHMPQGVSLVNAQHELESWNQRFIDLSGVSASAIRRGVNFIELLRGSDVYEEAVAFHSVQAEPNASGCFYEKDKPLDNGMTLVIRSNQISGGGYVNTYTDITDRSRAAEALRESEHRIRLITNAMPALISYINSSRCYEFANRAFEDWFACPIEEIEGKYLWQVLGDTDYASIKDYVSRALAGETVNFEVESDQRRRTSFKTYIPHYGVANTVVGFFALEQDVTEQRRTALALKHAYQHMEQRVSERTKELRDLNNQLQQEVLERGAVEQELLEATRVAELASESKVKFMAAAGHDLLQPLNAARLFSAALLEKGLADDVQRLASSLGRSLDDVESIITTLVDISKLEAGVVESIPEPFAIDELLDTMANEFMPQSVRAGLEFRYVSCSMVVHSDSQLLARILRNFLTNAIRYTDSGRVLLGCRRRPDGLYIEVHDTGIGIPEDQLPLIFQEFQRVHGSKARDDKGLGLGLAIVEKLAKVLGCEVFARSQTAEGSVFTVRVPYGHLREKEISFTDSLPINDGFAGLSVLVIDNDADICEGMEVVLSAWDCEVVTVQTLKEVAEVSEAMDPPPDLIIVDYHLDDDDTGLDALEVAFRQVRKKIPVIMITADYTRELRQQVGDLGYRFLNKPVKPLKLRALMTSLLGS